MSNDTQVKQEAPERIWIDAAPHLIADATRHIYIEPPPPHFRDFNSIEYVRADLLATVRKEEREAAFREFSEALENKRRGTTARYAYGGYSRELWHLNVETLNTVCNELLKELTR